MNQIRIAIADDHPMVIKGLQNIIADYPHIILTGIYATGAALLQDLRRQTPDVLLLDIHLPDKTGVELAPVILDTWPAIRILTLTNADSALYVRNMLRHGVHGYALKTIDPEKLIQAVEAVHRGEQYIDASLREKVEETPMRNRKETFLKASLTPREQEILKMVVEGFTNQEIAAKLFVGIKTVEYYRINLLLKLDVKNTAQLVKKSLEMGLTD